MGVSGGEADVQEDLQGCVEAGKVSNEKYKIDYGRDVIEGVKTWI